MFGNKIPVNSISEEVYLWTNDIKFSAHLFMGRPMLIFSKKDGFSITDYSIFYNSDLLLTTLTTLFCKTKHKKKQSLLSTLTTLIYMKK